MHKRLPLILSLFIIAVCVPLFFIATRTSIFGQQAYNIADINKDGIVDISDYSILAANFFKTGPDSSPTPTGNTVSYSATLTPQVSGTQGYGSGTLVLNSDNTATVTLSFSNLSSGVTGVHIHGPSNGNPDAILFTFPNAPFQNQQITLTAAQITDLNAGRLYFNVHTQINGGGEIKGFLQNSGTGGATPTPAATPVSGGTNSYALGLWDPADAKYAATGPQKYPVCSKVFHDSYKVQGPDGKWYPTWHPPVATDPSTGVKCTFGHEHGRNPTQSLMWSQVQEYFYYDANKNGQMDTAEKQAAGVPFGYANEQLDAYSASKGQTTMRHEDHVGNKIDYINGEIDSSGEFGSAATGGVVIPIRTASGDPKWTDSGAKCMYFMSLHQGVNSPDAFTNNLHAVSFFADCHGPTTAYDMKSSVTNLVPFGASGEFSNLCDPEGDRTTPVVLGKDSMNMNYPGTRSDGLRDIIQRSCLEKYFLVPEGQYSMNPYEAWVGSLSVRNSSKTLLSGINITLDIEDTIRYYDPNRTNKIGYFMDLCYEVEANGDKARGTCNATNYGTIQGIKWNDTRSDYKGLHRGAYFQGPRLFNAGGSEVWYTDPYGGNAQTTPFTGSIKQVFSAKNVDYLSLGNIDPRNNDRQHDSGEGTVHAPN